MTFPRPNSPADLTDGAVISDDRLRALTPGDVPRTVDLVYELARYEKLPDRCHLTADQLHAALFAPRPALYGLAAFDSTAEAAQQVGYALYFPSFSTWEGVHGIYLEDLYVRPEHRGRGLGRAMLTTLAATASARGYARVEWSVLDWNAPSIAFYRSLGAVAMDGWSMYRLTGPALSRTAEGNAGSNGSRRV